MTPTQLLNQLATEGGAIVSSGICSELEIADAQATGRFAVDDDGLGFVRRTTEWVKRADKKHEDAMFQRILAEVRQQSGAVAPAQDSPNDELTHETQRSRAIDPSEKT